MQRDHDFVAWARLATPQLHRRALMLCMDWHHAEDLTQETLARMYTGWTGVDQSQNPTGYAMTTLMRLFLSRRRRASASEVVMAALPEVGWDAGEDVDRRVDLAAVLGALTPQQRCVLIARYVDDLSVADVAEQLHKTESWVRVTAHRALRRLRDDAALTPYTPLAAASSVRS